VTNPFQVISGLKRSELPLAILMFSYFFLVITSFWILKPIKKALFITFYDTDGFNLFGWQMMASQAELLAKVLNMVVAFAAVAIFTTLVRKMHRQQLTFVFSGFFLVCYGIYSILLSQVGDAVVWSFYLFGDLYSTLMVATFFAFMNDSVNADEAKRMYGLVVLGGVTGGVFGTSALRLWIDTLSSSQWMWVLVGVGLVIVGVAYAAGRLVERRPSVQTAPAAEKDDDSTSKKNAAFEGAAIVFRSKYLLSIVAIVGLYEIVSTVLDFQFTSTIAHYLDGPAIGEQFANVFAITNWTSLIVQFFLTSIVLSRFGIMVALAVLPVVMIFASGGFLIFPILWMGSLLNTADNGFSYSINQSAKETLYVPTDRDTKYKAKAFIDMFVQRFAKAVAVGVSLLVTGIFTSFDSIRWLSLFTIAIVVLWLLAVRYAGKEFKRLTQEGSE
jgi:ATP:ADP antiporter, AAA family